MRVFSHNIFVDLVKSTHVLALIVKLDQVALGVVLAQPAEQGSELHALVPVLDELKQGVPHVLLEKVQREYNREEIGYLLFKDEPEVVLLACHYCQLFFGKHGEIRDQLDKAPFIRDLSPQLLPTHPPLRFSLTLRTNFEALTIGGKIEVGISHYDVQVLGRSRITKS